MFPAIREALPKTGITSSISCDFRDGTVDRLGTAYLIAFEDTFTVAHHLIRLFWIGNPDQYEMTGLDVNVTLSGSIYHPNPYIVFSRAGTKEHWVATCNKKSIQTVKPTVM